MQHRPSWRTLPRGRRNLKAASWAPAMPAPGSVPAAYPGKQAGLFDPRPAWYGAMCVCSACVRVNVALISTTLPICPAGGGDWCQAGAGVSPGAVAAQQRAELHGRRRQMAAPVHNVSAQCGALRNASTACRGRAVEQQACTRRRRHTKQQLAGGRWRQLQRRPVHGKQGAGGGPWHPRIWAAAAAARPPAA